MNFRIYAAMNISPDSLFKALADQTRLRCLMLMADEGELCVCELTHALNTIQPMISRHLAQLREVGIVADRRQGQWIYYRLHPDLPPWVKKVITATAKGVVEAKPFAKDRAALHGMPNRPGAKCCA